jgi:arylsulfatase A-like enzyme
MLTKKNFNMEKFIFLTRAQIVFCLVCLFLAACQTEKNSGKVDPEIASKLQLPDRPNILWLVTEDMGPYIPSFGDSTILTPNLSRLASEGVRYTNVYSPSGVCAPSRASIATGMYPSSIGANHMRTNSYSEVTGLPKYEAVPPPEVRMFSELLRMEGYYCTNKAKNDYQFKAPVTSWDENGENAHWRNRDPEQPFFSIFNFAVTHESGLFEPYQRTVVVSEETQFPIPPYLPDNEIVQRDLWKMYNNIALMDRQVGAILDQLEEDGLLEKTIIFFYSDHGGPLPRQKRLVYDAGLKVPLIVRFPNKLHSGTTNDQLISFVDFAPTILTLTGQTPPKYLHGRTFIGDKQIKRKYIHAAGDRFDAFTDAIRAVRDNRFKYIRNYRPNQGYYLPVSYRERIPTMQELLRLRDNGQLNEIQALWFRERKPKEELYDCINDPHEIENLALQPEYAEKLLKLSAEMDRWLNEIGDQPKLPERELISQLWEGKDTKPVTSEPIIASSDGKITITCSTVGASLGVKIIDNDGTIPKAWTIYQEPFATPQGTNLMVKAHRLGFKPSEIIENMIVDLK